MERKGSRQIEKRQVSRRDENLKGMGKMEQDRKVDRIYWV